jgi:acyl-CoA reductase-like NAD-dependent aldehyde dehydrogenase
MAMVDEVRKVCGYVDDGLNRKDARLVFGGLPPKQGPLSEGYFAIPTVFADTSNDWRLARVTRRVAWAGNSRWKGCWTVSRTVRT